MQAVNNFIRDLGITRAEGGIHFHKLEHAVRGDADANAPRCLAVLRPLRVVITNLPEDHFVEVDAKVSLPGGEDIEDLGLRYKA